MRALTIATTVLLIATGSAPALAQTGTWTSHGPEGGSISAIAVDPRSPSRVYAGSLGAGVFLSTERGEIWTGTGPANAQVVTLAIDTLNPLGVREPPGQGDPNDVPSNGVSTQWPRLVDDGRGASAIVYAGTLGLGVFRSADGGRTWAPSNSGLTTRNVLAVVIDPSDSNVLYAGTTFGVFKSVDAGASWTSVGSLSLDVRALAIDPVVRTVYAGTSSGVFKSTDAGVSWTRSLFGPGRSDIRALAIAPQTASRDATPTASPLYAGVGEGAGGPGAVFVTTDGGSLWNNTGLATPGVRALAIDPASPKTIYVGALSSNVFRSGNAGQTWTTSNTGLVNAAVLSLSLDPDVPRTIYAGTNDGVVKSTDGGDSWNVVNRGLVNTFVFALTLDRVTPTTLYAGMDEPEIFRTTDAGESWILKNSGLPDNVSVQAVAIDAITPSVVYAGLFGGGVFRSTDGGESWSAANLGLTSPFVQALSTDPVTTGIVYAATTAGVFKSGDGGATWIKNALSVNVRSFAIAANIPRVIYAATAFGVFKSFDGGDNWFSFNGDQDRLPDSQPQVLAIAPIAPTIPTMEPSVVYVGMQAAGVFKSTDAGKNWKPANAGLTNTAIRALAIDPSNPDVVYAGTGAGVFKSVDGGGSWVAVDAGLTNTAIRALAIDPVVPSIVYAATFGGGVFVLRQ